MPDIYLYRPYTPQGSPTPSTPNSEHQHTSSDNSSRCSGAHHEHGGRTLQLCKLMLQISLGVCLKVTKTVFGFLTRGNTCAYMCFQLMTHQVDSGSPSTPAHASTASAAPTKLSIPRLHSHQTISSSTVRQVCERPQLMLLSLLPPPPALLRLSFKGQKFLPLLFSLPPLPNASSTLPVSLSTWSTSVKA